MFKTIKTRFFWLWFTIVTTFIFLGIILSLPIGQYLYEHNGLSVSAGNDGSVESIWSFLLLVGLFMGFGQWIVINTKIKKRTPGS